MKKLDNIREKAVVLREKGYSLGDICDRLNRSKTTVYYWIKDVEIKKKNVFLQRTSRKIKKSTRKASLANRKKHQIIHKDHKDRAIEDWNNVLKHDDSFRQFIMLYWCEGYKRTKHVVNVANSDERLIRIADKWFKKLNNNKRKISYLVQIHADQDEQEINDYWKSVTGKNPKLQRKSNSGKMKGRNWNSKYGVLTIMINNAYLKTQIDTWIDLLAKDLV